MHISSRPLLAAILLTFTASACTEGEFFRPVREADEQPRGIRLDQLLGNARDAIEGETALPVNAFIWRASLETVDALPIQTADPFTGVIATDWGSSNAATDERFRVNVFVDSFELSVDSLRVTAFRQVADGGRWVDAPLDPQVIRDIEDTILLRARELRIAENS